MTMLDALRAITQPGVWMWARPITWRGCGVAFCFNAKEKDWLMVPSSRGGTRAVMPAPAQCFGEWEVVTPQTVNEERP